MAPSPAEREALEGEAALDAGLTEDGQRVSHRGQPIRKLRAYEEVRRPGKPPSLLCGDCAAQRPADSYSCTPVHPPEGTRCERCGEPITERSQIV
jgi:hypothetical protein